VTVDNGGEKDGRCLTNGHDDRERDRSEALNSSIDEQLADSGRERETDDVKNKRRVSTSELIRFDECPLHIPKEIRQLKGLKKGNN